MFHNKKENIKRHLVNIQGWRTNRKIVVFESDDWGSIRTSSKENLNKLKKFGLPIEKCSYMLNDALASNEDVTYLLELLESKASDENSNPIITANCLTANPDFEKIKASNFEEYVYEPIEETFKAYPDHDNVLKLWREGEHKSLFKPQLHGREHLNISRWMRDLKAEVKDTRLAFELNMFGISGHVALEKRGSYQAAFDGGTEEVTYNRKEIVKDAVQQFKQLFGYNSATFIAPNYTWNDEIEKALSESGVDWMQGTNTQRYPRDYANKLKIKRHYLGQKNKYGQRYLIRNCFFEPTSNQNKDWIDSCLKEMDIAFRWKKPAIVSTHRVNFVGFINPENRDKNLKLFAVLLDRIIKKWPDVEFMSSADLVKLM